MTRREARDEELRVPDGYEQIKVRGVTKWVPPAEGLGEGPIPPLSHQNLRDEGQDPWVWGTIERYGVIFDAFLLRNGDVCYDKDHLGKDRWDEWIMPSRRVRETWRRGRDVS